MLSKDDLLDSAIMDVIEEWAQRIQLEHGVDIGKSATSHQGGGKEIAKDLLLNGVRDGLLGFHANLQSQYKKDAVASEGSPHWPDESRSNRSSPRSNLPRIATKLIATRYMRSGMTILRAPGVCGARQQRSQTRPGDSLL